MSTTDHSPPPTESDSDDEPAESGFGMAHPTVVPANFDPETRKRRT